MRRIVVFIVLAGIVAVTAGCSKSPHDVGYSMAEQHMKVAMNPNPAQKARMQRELSREIEDYSLADRRDFMEGYLEAVATAVQDRMQAQMLRASR